jgi:hypothetical protein
MRKGLERQLLDVVSPFLQAGEQPAMSTLATLGENVHSIREITRGAVRESISSMGTFTLRMPRRFFLLLTDRRLLFVASSDTMGKPLPDVVGELPREGLRFVPVPGGIMKSFDVTGPDGVAVIRVNFALPQRGDSTRLAEMVNGVTTS